MGVIVATLAAALAATVTTAGPGSAAGLRNDYVRAADGSTSVISGYDKTRAGSGIYVYDSSWGTTTQQNQWGSEAVVEGGRVTALTTVGQGGNARIPADGYTLSGYGSGATWMSTHLKVGDPVTIEKDVILETSVSVTARLDALDPQPPYQFPGGRGGNQLVAYTDAYGPATTGTNQYGTEAVAVAEGSGFRVTAVGGNDSTIPSGGLVLSGHGTQLSWIQANVIPGTLLTLDRTARTVTATTDATSYLYLGQRGVDVASAALEKQRAAFADAPLDESARTLEQARTELDRARALHASGDDRGAIAAADAATTTAEKARQLTIESRAVETRAVWHRPGESSPAEVEKTVAAMADAGVNQLYLEAFWGGRTIYPTPLAEQNSTFAGWDPLAAFVASAKKHHVKLHLWMHTFYVGTDSGDGSGNGSPVAAQHPDWLVVDKAGRTRSTTEPGYYFVDPAVPAARAWLLDLFTEAVTRYAVDGLQLDYIRYPKQAGPDTVTSYNATARAAFKAQHGVDPADLAPGDAAYQTWLDWQTEQVSSFVRDARAALPKDILLSSALETTDNDADIRDFHQDFAAWVRDGLLDTVAPEVYTAGTSDVLARSIAFGTLIGDHAFTSIGIAPSFVGAPPSASVDQVAAARTAGATGVSHFVWRTMTPDVQQALRRSVYRQAAVDPQSDTVGAVRVGIADLRRRVTTTYAAGLDTPVRSQLNAQLGVLDREVQRGAWASVDRRLTKLERVLDGAGVPDGVAARAHEDLTLLRHILDVAKPAGWTR